MLKILKYELIGSYRQYLLTFVVYLLLCIAAPLLPGAIGEFLSGLLMVAIFGIVISIFVNITTCFSRSMFSRSGYLTLTLPVSSKVLVLSKLVGAMIWSLLAFFILGFGMVMLIMLVAGAGLSEVFLLINQIWFAISGDPILLIQILINIVFSVLVMIASFYFVITLVHTKYITKHRILIGVGIYIMGSIILGLFFDTRFMTSIINSLSFSQYWTLTTIGYALSTALFFFGTTYLIDKKLQIE